MQDLTPFDAETFAMLESLTERDVIPFNAKREFTVLVYYDKHNSPEYINAVINAARGRWGERFISVNDYPESKTLMFTIEYDKQDLPTIDGFTDVAKPDLRCGELFVCYPVDRDKEQVRAIQVKRTNHITVAMFCGNGTIQIERRPGGKAWFTFLNNGVYVDVPENDWIVKRPNTNAFEIWKNEDFKKVWNAI